MKNDVQLLKDQNHKFQEASSFFENQTEKLEQLQTQLQGMKKKLQENESTVSELKKERDNLSNRLRQVNFHLFNFIFYNKVIPINNLINFLVRI